MDPTHRPKEVGDLLYSDIMDFPCLTREGYKYVITFIDGKSRYTCTYLLKNKSGALTAYTQYTAWFERQSGRVHKIVRTDNGGEYTSKEFADLLSRAGTYHQTTIPHTPEQGGAYERWNLTSANKIRCALIESQLPASFWGELMMTATYLTNISPTASLKNMTPFESFYGYKPDIRNLRTIGCTAYALNTSPNRKKLDQRAIRCILVGYLNTQKGWRLYNPDTKSFIHSRSVTFNEMEMGYPIWKTVSDEPPSTAQESVWHEQSDSQKQSHESHGPELVNYDNPEPPNSVTYEDTDAFHDDEDDVGIFHDAEGLESDDSEDIVDEPEALVPNDLKQMEGFKLHSGPSNPKRISIPRKALIVGGRRFRPKYAAFHYALAARYIPQDIRIPDNQAEAKKSEFAAHWAQAEEAENKSIEENKVFGQYCVLPDGYKAIDARYVYDLKKNPDGSIERFKARLVAKGFRQRFGKDFTETFAPTAKHASARIILAHAATTGMTVIQTDVKTAFLNSRMEEIVYIRPPPGFSPPGKENMVLPCLKSLYGLKQSGRNWYRDIDQKLRSDGFKRSRADHSVYTKLFPNGEKVIMAVYVDDCLIAGSTGKLASDTVSMLETHYQMKIITTNRFVGLEYNISKEDQTCEIHQKSYVTDILDKFAEYIPKKLSKTPMSGSETLTLQHAPQTPSEIKEMESIPYATILGSLMFLMIGSRPDISHSMGILSRFMSNPGMKHWQALRRVLSYLKLTRDMSLHYSAKHTANLFGYSDSDFAGCLDSRKSVSGYVFLWKGAAITWKSQKQPTIASSSCHAEYIALAESGREAVWLQSFMKSVGIGTTTTQIFGDNDGAMASAKDPMFHSRMKHIDVKYHAIREWVESGIISIIRCDTENMVADSLTKPVPFAKSEYCRIRFGLC
jgi:transposase InsO family protein